MQTEVGTDDFRAVRCRKLGDQLVKRRGDLGDRLVSQCVGDTGRKLRQRHGPEQASRTAVAASDSPPATKVTQ